MFQLQSIGNIYNEINKNNGHAACTKEVARARPLTARTTEILCACLISIFPEAMGRDLFRG